MTSTIILSGFDVGTSVAAQVNRAFRSADRVIIIDPGETAELAARAGAITVDLAVGLPDQLAEHIALSIAREIGDQVLIPSSPALLPFR